MVSAGNAQQLVEEGTDDRFQKASELVAADVNPHVSIDSPSPDTRVKRPMATRKTAQVTCTMDHEHRDYLKRLAIRLSNEGDELVTISGALRYLIEKSRELNL
jgi:hypothetical protein